MRKYRTAVLTGIAALAAAGVGFAAGRDMHVMKVDLPDGSVARIEYKGDIAPKVTFGSPSPATPAGLVSLADASPFETFDRIAADMERQTQAMLHEVSALQATSSLGNGKPDLPALRKLPTGTIRYQFISVNDGRRTCDRTVEVTYDRDRKPNIVSTSSGDCKTQAPTPARSGRAHAPVASKT